MATERDVVLKAVVEGSSVEVPKLDAVMLDAARFAETTKQLALTQDHARKMRNAELGWFGVVFGGEAHASIVVAFAVVIMGFFAAIGLWTVAYFTKEKPEFWASEAHVALGAATSALGYVFGRGSKERSRSKSKKNPVDSN